MKTNKRISMIELYLSFAQLVSKRSTCERYGTGAVITSKNLYHIYSFGYNGSPKGFTHDCNGNIGNCQCIHSEINAILKCNIYDPHKVMFSTHSPCAVCARYMVQSGFSSLYYSNAYRILEGLFILEQGGIEIIKC